MAWVVLCVAGAFEVAWAVGLKYADGFTRPAPAILTVLAMGASFGCLTFAIKVLPVGTAYAVWTGIGAAGTTLVGVYLFGEPVSVLRLASVAMVLIGIVGLRLSAQK